MKTTLFGATAIGLLASLHLTSAVGAEGQEYDAAEAKLRTVVPPGASIALSETPIEGLLQAQVDNEIMYLSSDGSYLMQGTLYEIETRTNLTDQAKSVLRRDAVRDIDTAEQIVFTPENPEYELMVFTDIDCGYCRKLHSQIDEYLAAGIEVQYLLYPRSGPASNSWTKAERVWCADNRGEALTLAKLDKSFATQECDASILSKHYDIGRDVGLTGTPAIVLSDGTLMPGYLPPDRLLQRLAMVESVASN